MNIHPSILAIINRYPPAVRIGLLKKYRNHGAFAAAEQVAYEQGIAAAAKHITSQPADPRDPLKRLGLEHRVARTGSEYLHGIDGQGELFCIRISRHQRNPANDLRDELGGRTLDAASMREALRLAEALVAGEPEQVISL
jgi:hypothetical protein